MQSAIMVGRVCRDPEITYTPAGKLLVKFGFAVDKDFTPANGERGTNYFNMVMWEKRAERFLKLTNDGATANGKPLLIESTPDQRSWEVEGGGKRSAIEFTVDDFDLLPIDWFSVMIKFCKDAMANGGVIKIGNPANGECEFQLISGDPSALAALGNPGTGEGNTASPPPATPPAPVPPATPPVASPQTAPPAALQTPPAPTPDGDVYNPFA